MKLTKQINICLMAADNLRRFKGKTIAVIVSLTITMAVCSFMMFTRGGFIRDAETARDFLPDVTVQGIEAGRVAQISLDIIPKIKDIPHVKYVFPRVWGYIPLKIDETDVSYTLMGLDIDHFPHEIDHNTKNEIKLLSAIEDGYFLVPGDRKKAVLGYGVAESFRVDVGDIFAIAQKFGVDVGEIKNIGDKIKIEDLLGNSGEFEIVGVFSNKVQIYTTDLIIVSNEDARNFFGYAEDKASDLLVYLDDPAHADNAAFMISQLFENTRVMTSKALTDLLKEAFGRRGGTFQAMWLIMLMTLLLLIWAQSAHIGVDVSREIGILKAVGWQTGDIIKLKMFESLICGLFGTIGGILLGFVYALMGTPGISGYCIGCASVYPKFPVPVSCDFGSLFLIFLLGVVPVTMTSAIPAWLTGTIEPDEAMRS